MMAGNAASGLLQAVAEAPQGKGRPSIGAEEFQTLESRYDGDPRLLRLYKLRLLKPGWAGKKDAVEREYIRRVKARRGARS